MLPSQTAEDSLLIRNAVFVVKLKELRFVAVIATKSFMLHVLGNKDTSLVLRSSPSVLPRYSGDIPTNSTTRSRAVDEIRPPQLHLKANLVA